MKVSIPLAALAVALGVNAQGPTIQTPFGVQQCAPIQLQLSGGKPPYQVSVLPGGQSTAAPIEDIAESTSDTTLTWNVNIQGGTTITLRIRDSTGAINFSDLVTIQMSSNNNCLNSTASTTPGGTSAPASGSSTSSSAPVSSSAPTNSSSAVTTPATSAPTTPTAPSTTGSPAAGSSGASSNTASTASRTSSSSSSGTAAGAQQTNNNNSGALSLTSGSAAGVVGALLAYILA